MRFTNIDVNEKVNLFNKTIKNIIQNYIPHETIICDDRDSPWINKDIKELIHEKNQAYKSNRQNKNNTFFVHQFAIITPCSPLLHDDKFITNFKQNAEISDSFFVKQCSLKNTNSDLP